MSTLQSGSTLQNGKYEILRVLGQGGCGVTYLALQQGLNRIVAIKEFFIENFCVRNADTHHVTIVTESSREFVERYRGKFLKEARNIAKLDHPNIVSIIDVFEENSTAYYVMKYAQNGSLDDKVKREDHLSEAEATRYILKIANALRFVHQHKMTHLNVKPANILLSANDEPWLIDFGLSKQVSWDDCQTFICKLNALTGKNFRLPTEAEWEFAARGGNQSRHTQYSGSSRIDDVAWYNGIGNKTHPVKTKQPNELGIYDMTGNADEWCQDWYGDYSSYAQINPTGAGSRSKRVVRGGCWLDSPRYCHSSIRFSYSPENSIGGLGLRIVLSQ